MKKLSIIIIAPTALLLTGYESPCGNYERPDAKMGGIVCNPIDDRIASGSVNDFGNLPWCSVFTDPHLQTLAEKALNNNPDLLDAVLNVDTTEQQAKATELSFLPSVVLALAGTISHLDTHTSSAQFYILLIAASWEVDLSGKLHSSKKTAQVTMMRAQDYKVYTQTTLVSSIANLYYTPLMPDRQRQIVDGMLGLTKSTWDVVKLQAEFGRTCSTSVQGARAAFYSVQTQTAGVRRQIYEAGNTLGLLLGEPAQAVTRDSLGNQSLSTNFMDGVDVQLLGNHADVYISEMALAQCFYNIQIARSRFYLTTTISPTGVWANSGGMVNPSKLLLSIVGSLT